VCVLLEYFNGALYVNVWASMGLIHSDVLMTSQYKKWLILGGLSTGSDGRVQQKAVNNSIPV